MSGELFLGRGRVDEPLVQHFVAFVRSPSFRMPPVPMVLGALLDANPEMRAPESDRGVRDLLADLEGSVYRGHQCERLFLGYWRHAVASAVASELVSAAISRPFVSAFVLGLLHDVGRPIALNALLTEKHHVPALAHATETVLSMMVDEVHDVVGGVVAARWGLGKRLIQVVGGHHSESLLDHDTRYSARLVAAADVVSAEIGCGSHASATPRLGQLDVLHAMGVASTGTIVGRTRDRSLKLLGL